MQAQLGSTDAIVTAVDVELNIHSLNFGFSSESLNGMASSCTLCVSGKWYTGNMIRFLCVTLGGHVPAACGENVTPFPFHNFKTSGASRLYGLVLIN